MGPLTLLLVDDDVVLLHLLRQRPAHDGFQVITAEGGEQALRVLDHYLPDLVIVDLLLSDVDSLQLVEQIRKQGDVPVIFLTSIHDVRVRAEDVQRCAEDYAVKPFEYEELLDRIRRVLDRSGGTTNRESTMDTKVGLTERQLEVLQLAAAGATNNEIAMRLTISAQTVSWHTSRISAGLGIMPTMIRPTKHHEETLEALGKIRARFLDPIPLSIRASEAHAVGRAVSALDGDNAVTRPYAALAREVEQLWYKRSNERSSKAVGGDAGPVPAHGPAGGDCSGWRGKGVDG